MADNDKIWADGEDPLADFRKTMEASLDGDALEEYRPVIRWPQSCR